MDINDMKTHYCTGVTLWVTEYDLLLFPKAKIDYALRYAKEMGMKGWVDLWGFGNITCHNAIMSQFVEENYDTWQVASDGKPTPIACPNNAKFRKWFKKQITDFIKRYPVDGFVFDEIHFDERGWPGVWHCRCKTCKQLFKEKFGREMPVKLTDEVSRFRRETMVDFIDYLCTSVKECDPSIETSICLYPEVETPSRFGTEDWEGIAKIKNLDILGSDPYWVPIGDRIGVERSPYKFRQYESLISRYEWFTEKIIKLSNANNKRSCIWVQTCCIPAGREDEVYIATMTAARKGVDIIGAWSYMDYSFSNPSDDPRLVFEKLTKAYAESLKIR
jgi:hypothetical protein